jgi:cell division protein FtsN
MNINHTQKGSTTLGIIVGVVLGLSVALGVSLYLANSGAPLQTKAVTAPPRIEAPKDVSKIPDPNEALYTKVPKAEEPTPSEPSAAAKAAAVKPEQDAIGKIAALVTPAPTAANSATETLTMPKTAPATAGSERYFVQAGAFSSLPEAEALKAKLALQGVTMTVSAREKDGQTLQRVRTAPLASVDAEKLRNNLKANGIETSLVKVQ